jgi:hypothetical protein
MYGSSSYVNPQQRTRQQQGAFSSPDPSLGIPSGSSSSSRPPISQQEIPLESYITVDLTEKRKYDLNQEGSLLSEKKSILEKEIRTKQAKLEEVSGRLEEVGNLLDRLEGIIPEGEGVLLESTKWGIISLVIWAINIACVSALLYELDKVVDPEKIKRAKAFAGGCLALGIVQGIVIAILYVKQRKEFFPIILLLFSIGTIALSVAMMITSDISNAVATNAQVTGWIYFAFNVITLLYLVVSILFGKIGEKKKKKKS